jgi:hypothetical protein
MKAATSSSANKTGLASSPTLAAELVEATRDTVPSMRGDARSLAAVRIHYARAAEPAGTMPPPAGLKEGARTGARALRAQKANILMDKLGERLAFERASVRLYDALISKLQAFGSWPGGPSRSDLEVIRAEEHGHFLLIKRTIEGQGSDSTAVTPSANAQAVLTRGLSALLGDPRTDLRQGLEAVLAAELIDCDGWENLGGLAKALGQDALAVEMNAALEQERRHLRRVRGWISAALFSEATGEAPTNGGTLRGAAPAPAPRTSRQRATPQRGRRSAARTDAKRRPRKR